MEFNEYQQQAAKTNIYTEAINDLLFPIEMFIHDHYDGSEIKAGEAFAAISKIRRIMNITYALLGYGGEVAELQNKFKKVIRGDKNISDFVEESVFEQGDCLWYAAELASNLDHELNDIAQMNVAKLHSRRERQALGGDGDNR